MDGGDQEEPQPLSLLWELWATMHPGHTSISGLVWLESSQLLPRSRSPGAQIHKLEAQVERGALKMQKAPWLFGPTQLEDITTLLSLASWLLSLVAWPGSCWDTGAPLAWVSLSSVLQFLSDERHVLPAPAEPLDPVSCRRRKVPCCPEAGSAGTISLL